jgi:hypothetical protein
MCIYVWSLADFAGSSYERIIAAVVGFINLRWECGII